MPDFLGRLLVSNLMQSHEYRRDERKNRRKHALTDYLQLLSTDNFSEGVFKSSASRVFAETEI